MTIAAAAVLRLAPSAPRPSGFDALTLTNVASLPSAAASRARIADRCAASFDLLSQHLTFPIADVPS